MIDLVKNLATVNRRTKGSIIRELLKLTNKPEIISFAGGLPAPQTFPSEKMAELAQRIIKENSKTALQYGPTDGLPELKERRVDGVIHYVQAFCHRGIGDIVLREGIKLPMLTVEGNTDYNLTQHLKTRLEAFLDVVKRRRDKSHKRSGSKT